MLKEKSLLSSKELESLLYIMMPYKIVGNRFLWTQDCLHFVGLTNVIISVSYDRYIYIYIYYFYELEWHNYSY